MAALLNIQLPSLHDHNYGDRFLTGKVQAQARLKEPDFAGRFEQSEKSSTRRNAPQIAVFGSEEDGII